MDSAWMPSESRLPSASYTSRCRARSRRPSNFGDTISTLKCVSASAAPVGSPRPGDAAQALSPGFGDYGADSVMLSPTQLESAVGLDFLPGSGDASRRSSYGSESSSLGGCDGDAILGATDALACRCEQAAVGAHRAEATGWAAHSRRGRQGAVSYTHLTLPTILLV